MPVGTSTSGPQGKLSSTALLAEKTKAGIPPVLCHLGKTKTGENLVLCQLGKTKTGENLVLCQLGKNKNRDKPLALDANVSYEPWML